MTAGPSAKAGLYVHVPFCSFVCPYCDFAVKRLEPGAADLWLEALLAEAELRADWEPPFDSVYLGGGTPSILGPQRLHRLLAGLRSRLPIEDEAVLHMEANPEDVTAASLAAWRELGVSFLSLGIQSFVDRELRFLGRRHDAAGARAALELAIAADFDVLSVDLIFGLPDQSDADWLLDIETATPPGVDHLSCYQLTVKPGTLFSRRAELGRLREISDEAQGDFYLRTHAALAERGFSAYEVSNFARRPEARSRHNQKYWDHSPYLGLGPAAHSFAGRERFWNEADGDGAGVPRWHRSSARGSPRAPRRRGDAGGGPAHAGAGAPPAGIDLAELGGRFGHVVNEPVRIRLMELERAGLLVVEGKRVRLRPGGMAVADSIAADLLP